MPSDQAELRDQLRALGGAPVPAPSTAFLARLERRLAEEPAVMTSNLVAITPRRRGWVPAALAAAATVAAALLATALLGGFGDPGAPHSLRLGAAVNTKVVLPDGKTVPGKSGLQLPNGAVVQTGPNGSAAAGPVDLGPGLQATVAGGRLQLTPTPSIAAPPSANPPSPPTVLPPVTRPQNTVPQNTVPQNPVPQVTLPQITLPQVTVPNLGIPTTLPRLFP